MSNRSAKERPPGGEYLPVEEPKQMVSLRPDHVLVLDTVADDGSCRARVEAMLPFLGGVTPRVVTDAELNQFVGCRAYPSKKLWGEREDPRDPDVIFIRERYDSDSVRRERSERYPHLRYRNLLGYGGVTYRRDGTPEWRESTGTVCQPAWELHSANGCPFRCCYCWFGDCMALKANIEEQIEHLAEAFARAPGQAIWKWDNATDVNAFEPEWNAVAPMIERFAVEDRRWLLLYAGKSDNVDFMLNLEHRGQTVVCWSLSPATQATVLEPRTAGARERVAAAGKCDAAGYPVRFRFSPIIPVVGWRDEYRELIRDIFEVSRPDVISLCLFGWMDVLTAERCLDLDVIDPTALAAMREHGNDPDWTGGHSSPLPFAYREEMLSFLIDEIRSYRTRTMISICLDTPRIWESLGERVGQHPSHYFCNCGAHCAPIPMRS